VGIPDAHDAGNANKIAAGSQLGPGRTRSQVGKVMVIDPFLTNNPKTPARST